MLKDLTYLSVEEASGLKEEFLAKVFVERTGVKDVSFILNDRIRVREFH
jgi:hypothetical protein